jgi:hypothetical protein
MVVCISEVALGFFFRINSKSGWQKSLPLARIPHHTFLHHDSFLECGAPLELDEYIVEESLRLSGTALGVIHASLREPICQFVMNEGRISDRNKEAILDFLK